MNNINADWQDNHKIGNTPLPSEGLAPGVLVLPAWSNLAALDLVIGVVGAAVWWTVGTWLYWGHRLHYDENEYLLLAQSWIAGDVFALAGAPPLVHIHRPWRGQARWYVRTCTTRFLAQLGFMPLLFLSQFMPLLQSLQYR